MSEVNYDSLEGNVKSLSIRRTSEGRDIKALRLKVDLSRLETGLRSSTSLTTHRYRAMSWDGEEQELLTLEVFKIQSSNISLGKYASLEFDSLRHPE